MVNHRELTAALALLREKLQNASKIRVPNETC